ncbi:MAG TPA: hypothetical protein VJ183_18300 [Chloroflexia bacterium]|nr:hypothetical protein [Chloroflexia bacterium]
MDEHEEPFGWWGWHWQPPQPLSIMQIIDAGSTDTHLMALLWAMLSRRASVIVAAEPPMAGKTTTLTALLDLLPPDTKRVYLRGHYETFDFARNPEADPHNTYVLANEMSDHLAVYLWGSRIYKTFELIEKGYAIGSTMHAETVDDVIAILDSNPLNVPAEWIARLTLVINLYVSGTYGPSVRRFNSVHMLKPSATTDDRRRTTDEEETIRNPKSEIRNHIVSGVELVLLSHWDKASDTFIHCFDQPAVQAKLSAWAGCTAEEWTIDVARRKAHLDNMQEEGIRGIAATRRALQDFDR